MDRFDNFSGIDIQNLMNRKSVTSLDRRMMGIDPTSDKFVYKLEELRTSPPNIVVAECVKTVSFTQNKFKNQTLSKKSKYVMGLGVYQQLHYDNRRKCKILKPSRIVFNKIYKPYIGQDLTNKTLLVSRTGGIGDLLFIQPNLMYLKEIYPNCNIVFACGPQYQAMLESWNCIDKILDLPFNVQYLFSSDYQAIFEGVIERCEESKTTNSYKLFTTWLGLNLPDEKLVPIQYAKEDKIEECKKILYDWGVLDSPFIIFQLRASSPIRTPSPALWRTLINNLTNREYKIVITDSPHQNKTMKDFIETLDNKHLVFNFCEHSKTLDYTIAMVKLARLSVSTDSALIHIAASLGTKCFGIYGPFPGEVRLTTYKNCDWINCEDDCAPCFIHSPLPCRNAQSGHGKCYNKLNIDECVKRIEKLFGEENEI